MKLLILSLTFAAACAFAQQPAPAWLSQIKLSGLSGAADRRLAVINGKTFSPGETHDLKVAGKTATVKCLAIREQSVLVQIQDLASLYELTITGEILAAGKNPDAALPPQSVASIVPPAPAPVRPVTTFQPVRPASPPHISGQTSSVGNGWVFVGMMLALLSGIAIGTGAARTRHQKNIGEAMLADTIESQLSRPHLLLNNVTLPTADGTTQIDHVLVADTGIFVIETKHYSGWIFGHPQDSQWTQTIYRKKSRFQNPLHQNYGHIKTLQSLFDLPEKHFHSLVVFTADAEFKTDLGPNVVQLARLIPFLTAERPVLFDERQMAGIIGKIEMKRARRSLETDEYHRNHVRNRLTGKKIMQG